MTFGLVDVGYRLPEGQVVKLILFAPCLHCMYKDDLWQTFILLNTKTI